MMFRNPGEVLETIVRNRISIDVIEAKLEQQSYVKEQVKTQKCLKENDSKFKDSIPPCCNCKPQIFKHCQDNEIECSVFNEFVAYGKLGIKRKYNAKKAKCFY